MTHIEDYHGLCGIIPTFATSDLQIRCTYEFGHSGDCSFVKYKDYFYIWVGCNSGDFDEWQLNQEDENGIKRGFINSVFIGIKGKEMKKPICEDCENAENDPMGLYLCNEHGTNIPPGNRKSEQADKLRPIEQLRIQSGEIKSSDPMVSFLYELMRDHLSTGVVEKLIQSSENKQETLFTNGYLANYAKNLSMRLK